MAKASEFLRALSGAHERVQNVEDYWRRQQEEWIHDLVALRGSIKEWMTPVVEAKFATIVDRDFSTEEPDLGHYQAPGLTIELLTDKPRTVSLRPRGLRVVGVVESASSRVVGAMGRVDLECGVAREILLRFGEPGARSWFSFKGGEKRELDEDLFFDLLARTAGVALR